MYQPKGDEEALSYERACSKNASTFSWSAIDGHPPASFIRTDTTTSWKKRNNHLGIFTSNLRFKRFFDCFRTGTFGSWATRSAARSQVSSAERSQRSICSSKVRAIICPKATNNRTQLSHYNFVRPIQKSEAPPTGNCIGPKSKNISKREPHAVITLEMA